MVNSINARIAMKNMQVLAENPYPGRGIVIGTSANGRYAVQIYWIMGRSENSRNRVFGVEGGRLFTEAADPSKVQDPSLIIYNAMDETQGCFIVSNGNQTDTVKNYQATIGQSTLRSVLAKRQFEPDSPNFTPRITGVCYVGGCYLGSYAALTELSLLRRSEIVGGDHCARSYFEYAEIEPSYGFCVTTYRGDGNPLPAFEGEPYLLPILGNLTEVAERFWAVLNPENRVALAVKFINLETGESEIKVINRYTKVPPTA